MWDDLDRTAPRTGGEFRTTVGEGETATTALVRAIAAIENEEATEIERVFEGVDPEALNALCRRGSNARVAFSVEQYYVIAREDELIIHCTDRAL